MVNRRLALLVIAGVLAAASAAAADVAPLPTVGVGGCQDREIGERCNTEWYGDCACVPHTDNACPTTGEPCLVCMSMSDSTRCLELDDDAGGCAVPGTVVGSGLAAFGLAVGLVALVVARRRR